MDNEVNEILWYASALHVQRMGPFRSQVEAWESLRSDNPSEIHVEAARVWPERKT